MKQKFCLRPRSTYWDDSSGPKVTGDKSPASPVAAMRLADGLHSKQEAQGGIGICLPRVYMYSLACIIYMNEA